jgi:hypothetical protein
VHVQLERDLLYEFFALGVAFRVTGGGGLLGGLGGAWHRTHESLHSRQKARPKFDLSEERSNGGSCAIN